MWCMYLMEYSAIKGYENTDICYNMGKHQKYCAKLKKPDIKDCILYDFIYMKVPEKANL